MCKGTRGHFFVVVTSAGRVWCFGVWFFFFPIQLFSRLKANEFAGISLLDFILIEMVF